jgi:hypothetical protein
MSAPAITHGSLVDVRNVNQHKCVRLVIDIPAERAREIIDTFGWPTMVDPVPVAIARLAPSVQQQKEPAASSKTPVPTAKPRQTTLPGHPSYAQSLAIMCSKPQAWMFLFEKMGRSREINDPEQAAEAVRQLCGVQSRNETIIGTPKGDNANRLLSEFEGWKRGLA